MGKLTALKIKNLTEPGRYPDGDGLFLELNGKGSEDGFFGFSRTAGDATSASGLLKEFP